MKPILGTAQFGNDYGVSNNEGNLDIDKAFEILNFATSENINFFDTAIGYGESESILGKYGMNDYKVYSKLPNIINDEKKIFEWIFNEVNKSLLRLKINQLEGILFRSPSNLSLKNGRIICETLDKLRKEGLVKKIGVSIYDPKELNIIFDYMLPDVVQAPFNVFDQRILTSGWLKKLKHHSIEIQIRSIFLQGLLLFNQSELPKKFEKWKNHFENWFNFVNKSEYSTLEILVNSVLSIKEVDKFVVGVQNVSQLKSIIDVYKNPKPLSLDSFQTEDELLINPSKWS